MPRKKLPDPSRGARREIVIAPPGCGKTEKLAKALLDAVVNHPERSVLCITFTENVAAEMRRRAEKALSRSTGRHAARRICTLHSYCWQKLWKEASEEGVRLHVIDDGYLKDFSDTSGLDKFNESTDYDLKENPEIRLEQVVRAASYIRQGKEVHFEPWRKDAWQGKFREFTDKYIAFKEELNQPDGRNRYVDFNDILMEADGRIREGVWTERFDIVLVDEVQDLSSFQLDIIESLVAEDGSICFFGDPQQAIYSFMGANVRKLHSLWISCEEQNRHSFRVNHRSSAHIVNIINKYARNRIRVDKMWPGFNMKWKQIPSKAMSRVPAPDYGDLKLIHNDALDEDIALYHAKSLRQEVWKIAGLIDQFGPGESNAILALHNRTVDDVIGYLKQKKKYVILSASPDEHTYLPRLIRAHLLVCRYPEWEQSADISGNPSLPEEDPWVGILAFLEKGKGKKWAYDTVWKLRKGGVTPLDVIQGRAASLISDAALLKEEDVGILLNALKRYGPLFTDCRKRLKDLEDIPEDGLDKAVPDWLAYSRKHLIGSGLLVGYQNRQWDTILGGFKKRLKYASRDGRAHGLDGRLDLADGLLSEVRPEDLIPSYGPDRPVVHVMTVHKAKGLGFDNVFMCSSNQTWDYSGTAELDRVFFVGMTRAKKRLVISFSDPERTEEDLVLGRKPRSRPKDFSFIKDLKDETEGEDVF